MRWRDLITGMLVVALAASCNDNRKELNYARHSLYDVDFAVVYAAALEATRSLYPNLDENPGPGKIATSWHQVQYANCAGTGSLCDDSTGGMANPQVLAQQQGLGQGAAAGSINSANQSGAAAAGMPTRLAYRKYFIRFDVAVLGGRPWRVKVTGHASAWDPGAAMPSELHGADKPHWLDGRTEALQIAIYKRVKQYAVPMPDDGTDKPDPAELAKTDPSSFKNIPIGAGKQLAIIKDAIAKRDYPSMRPTLAEDVVWSLGGGTGADAAMAMWQADPTALDAMLAVLGNCVSESDKRVACPGGTVAPGAWQLVLEPRDDIWKVASFVKSE